MQGGWAGSPDPDQGERPHRCYAFGEFTLDVERRSLRRGSEELTLRPKSFEVLACLVEHHGQVVSKAALMETFGRTLPLPIIHWHSAWSISGEPWTMTRNS